MTVAAPLVEAFLRAASVPRDGAHRGGTLESADAIRVAHPSLATSGLAAAAALGDASAVRAHLAAGRDVRARVAPYGWTPLIHLCFSRYLRLAPDRADEFTTCVEQLLAAGADPNDGWVEDEHAPSPTVETVLYGAMGIAGHLGVTRALLAAGADPNDDETSYHAVESGDAACVQALLDSRRCTADTYTTLLVRAADWHDDASVALVLAAGGDANRASRWGWSGLQQAVRRDNALTTIERLLDHGGDATRIVHGTSAWQLAAARGRRDVLDRFVAHGVALPTSGWDGLLVAATRGDAATASALVAASPELATRLATDGAELLIAFAGNNNSAGLQTLVHCGAPVGAPSATGDGYWGLAPRATALHMAAWRLHDAAVATLLAAGAPVAARDATGATALDYAIRGCIASHWTERADPALVARLLAAGVPRPSSLTPTGVPALDAVLFPRA